MKLRVQERKGIRCNQFFFFALDLCSGYLFWGRVGGGVRFVAGLPWEGSSRRVLFE